MKSQGLGVHRWEEDDNLDYDFDHDDEDDDNDNGDNDTNVDNNDDVFSAEEIEQFGKSDLLVLSEMLGDKVTVMVVIIIINIIMIVMIIIITIIINWILQEFFFGDEPALLDLVVYAHVAQLVRMIKIIMTLISKFVLIISDIKGDGGGRDILSIERLH